MVHKKFRHDMKRGFGSCILTLKSCTDIEEYREDVAWGVKNALAYDAQCEGTRANYFYDMITLFSDWSEFYSIVAAGAKRNLKGRDWKFAYYTEILTLMAADGFAAAQQTLDELYDMLLKAIQSGRRTNIGLFPLLKLFR